MGKIFNTQLELSKADIWSCKQWAALHWKHINRRKALHDGFMEALIMNKMAEISFGYFIWWRYAYNVHLDYNISPGDVFVGETRVDVCGVASGLKWLLIEQAELEHRRVGNNLPDFYVMVSVGWEKGEPVGWTNIRGFVPFNNLRPGVAPFFPAGSTPEESELILPNDSIGIRVERLNPDWDAFMEAAQ